MVIILEIICVDMENGGDVYFCGSLSMLVIFFGDLWNLFALLVLVLLERFLVLVVVEFLSLALACPIGVWAIAKERFCLKWHLRSVHMRSLPPPILDMIQTDSRL